MNKLFRSSVVLPISLDYLLPTSPDHTDNPILKALYQRLIAKGKAKKIALTVLMRKLIILANKLLKDPNFSLAT
jgi:hypothetical protein